jgi:hypothetical protein
MAPWWLAIAVTILIGAVVGGGAGCFGGSAFGIHTAPGGALKLETV